MMFYRKNIYAWEQAARIIGSAGVALCAYILMPVGTLTYVIIASAIGFGLTGVFGFCPMCAMVGRKLKNAGDGK
jgi:hypothetical protein